MTKVSDMRAKVVSAGGGDLVLWVGGEELDGWEKGSLAEKEWQVSRSPILCHCHSHTGGSPCGMLYLRPQ